MSALRPAAVAAVLGKDFRILWPLALTALLAPLCIAFNASLELTSQAKQIFMMIGGLALAALVMTVIQQDGPANPRLDMRTRPVGPANLFTAKILFLCITVAAPLFAANVTNQLSLGHGWDEALLVGLSGLIEMVMTAIPVLILAMVTSSLIECGIVIFGMVFVSVVLRLLFRDIEDRGGVDWVADIAGFTIVLGFCVATLVLLLRRKDPVAARWTWIAGAALVVLLVYFTPLSTALAVQHVLSPRSEWEQKLALAHSEPCLELSGRMTSDLSPRNLPDGWRMQVDRAVVRHRDASGDLGAQVRAVLRPVGPGNRWRLNVARPQSSAAGGTTEWRYDLSLLQPTRSADFQADGRRRYLAGFGYCEASRRRETVYVGCFKPFGQPGAFSASVKSLPQQCLNCGSVNYRPAPFRVFGSKLNTVARFPAPEALPEPTVVTLTAYEARAHFTRRAVVAPSSSGALAACRRGPGE